MMYKLYCLTILYADLFYWTMCVCRFRLAALKKHWPCPRAKCLRAQKLCSYAFTWYAFVNLTTLSYLNLRFIKLMWLLLCFRFISTTISRLLLTVKFYNFYQQSPFGLFCRLKQFQHSSPPACSTYLHASQVQASACAAARHCAPRFVNWFDFGLIWSIALCV